MRSRKAARLRRVSLRREGETYVERKTGTCVSVKMGRAGGRHTERARSVAATF